MSLCGFGTKNRLMDTNLRVSKGYGNQVKYAVILPAFFFVFISMYDPFSFREYYDVGGKSWTFHLLMLTCIMAGVLALTRLLFSVLYKYITVKWWHYVLWCLGEVLVTSFFFALYASLFYINSGGMPYFSAMCRADSAVLDATAAISISSTCIAPLIQRSMITPAPSRPHLIFSFPTCSLLSGSMFRSVLFFFSVP